jgi:hypothetical protein
MAYVLKSRLYNDAYLHKNSGTNTKYAYGDAFLTHDVSQAKIFDDEAKAKKEIRRLTGSGIVLYFANKVAASYNMEPLEIFVITADDLAANVMLKDQWNQFMMCKKLCS